MSCKPAPLIYSAILLAAIACPGHSGAAAKPCSGIDRTLTPAEAPILARAVDGQLGTSSATILESFRFGGWRILYAGARNADGAFLFYAHDPASAHYVTLWAGAAMRNEGPSIKSWVLQNAPGIPPQLAACFAWHVTKDRGQ